MVLSARISILCFHFTSILTHITHSESLISLIRSHLHHSFGVTYITLGFECANNMSS